MARPKKDNADYFPHDSDMRNDPKVRALRRRHGLSGYAVYNYMLEVLTDSDFFEHEWNDLSIEILAGDFDIMPEDLKLIVDYCTSILQLFTIENDLIWCNTLRKRFDSLLSKRKRDRNRVIADENPQSKVKESKEKKRRVKKFTPPTPDEITKYGIEKGFNLNGKKISDYYTSADSNKWIDAKGNIIKNWKQKVLGVWCKDENKLKTDSKGEIKKVLLPENERLRLTPDEDYILGGQYGTAVSNKWITKKEAAALIINDPKNTIPYDKIREILN